MENAVVADSTTSPAKVPAASPPMYFLTNRFNLLEILSTGIIGPRGAFVKYRDDTLRHAAGRIPIFLGSVPKAFAEDVTSGDKAQFPVILELVSGALKGTAVSLDAKGKISKATLPLKKGNQFCVFSNVPIPVVSVSRVHFRSDAEKAEHSAREYSNVPGGDLEFSVSPALFDRAAGPNLDKFIEVAASLPPRAELEQRVYRRLDKLAGAAAMLAKTIPTDPMWRGLLSKLLEAGPRKKRAKASPLKKDAQWLEGIKSALLDVTPATGGSLNERIWHASLDAISDLDHIAGWDELGVLAAVNSKINVEGLSEVDRKKFEAIMKRIGSILKSDEELKPFGAGEAIEAARALLLFLLRHEPEKVLTWKGDPLGPSEQAVIGAAMLTGVFQGWTDLPMECKGGLGMRKQVGVLKSRSVSNPADKFETAAHSNPDLELFDPAGDAPTKAVVPAAPAKAEGASTKPGAPSMSSTPNLLEQLMAKELKGVWRNVAIELSRQNGWSCLSTGIEFVSGELEVSGKDGKSRLRIRGSYKTIHEFDEAGFHALLTKHPPKSSDIAKILATVSD